jgi:adenylate kinase family enzyme
VRDPLSGVRRIVVAGASGSGKTTLAARIGVAAGLPHTEIDAVHWHAEWTPNPRFVEDVVALAAGDGWVTEWQYDVARPLLTARAELLVWLDPPRPVVLARVLRRTLARRLGRLELWNGNSEPPLRTFFTDRNHIVRWSMRTLRSYPARIRQARAENPGLRLVRIRSARDADRLVARLAAAQPRV